MKKRTFKMAAVMMTSAILTIAAASTAFAGTWKQDAKGWWWQEDNGSYPISQWKWLDGNQDGVSECYYFGGNGYLLTNTTTPDGYTVNGDGQWMENGNIKTQGKQTATVSTTNTNTTEGSWEQVGNRWKFKKPDGSYVVDALWLIDSDGDGVYNMYSFDENGFLCDKNNGNYGQLGNYGMNKFGGYDSEGRMTSNNYHGNRQLAGPFEVVKRNGIWKDVSGMIDDGNRMNVPVTNDYYTDALGVIVATTLYEASLDVSGTIYKDVN